jgi:hypothetical protein
MRNLYKIFVVLGFFLTIPSFSLFAQVGINTDGSPPHSSAMLDVKAANKGFLPPRMTHAAMNNIVNPADGLIIYCIDCGTNAFGALSLFIAGSWYNLSIQCLNPFPPQTGIHIISAEQIIWNWNPVSGAAGYKWNTSSDLASAKEMNTATTYTETGLSCNTQYARYIWAYNGCGGISNPTTITSITSMVQAATPGSGTNISNTSSIQWNWNTVANAIEYKWSTINNFLTATTLTVPSYTETGLTCNTAYTSYAWAISSCGNSEALTMTESTKPVSPGNLVEGTHISSLNQIIWHWNPLPNATGYKWSTINNFSTGIFTPNTSHLESGLTCITAYTSYAWAIGACGNSMPLTMTKTTAKDPESPTSGVNVATTTQIVWNWNSVPGATGYKWSTTNDYTTATSTLGNATFHTETGLTCNTAYTSYAWAVGTCGNSTPLTMTKTTATNPVPPLSATHLATTTSINWNWVPVPNATGYKWNTINDYATATSTIGNVTSYLQTGLTCNTTYTSYAWAIGGCGHSVALTMTQTTLLNPEPPTAGTHVPGLTQIVWKWNAVAGATGYKWSVTNNFANAIDLGSGLLIAETGMTCNTPYTRYIWAYGACGNSTPATLTQTTFGCPVVCGSAFTINHSASGGVAPVDKTVTYGTATNIPGELTKCWITRNLGASQQATTVDDATEASAGWYFQFNRKQGYKHDGSARTPSAAWDATNDNLSATWEAAKDPCTIELGTGWRIPTKTEWTNVDASWTDWNGPFGSALKLHAAGYLYNSDGSLSSRGSYGYYWSSTQNDAAAGWFLGFFSGTSVMVNGNKAFGFSARCVRD